MRCTVEDVMTRDVVCAREDTPYEDTPYKELVRLLATRRVSAVPVVDGRRRVLGVVSEADLLLKQEHPARRAVRRLSALGREGTGPRPERLLPRS
jgi:CBS-domain-containing membrane protein